MLSQNIYEHLLAKTNAVLARYAYPYNESFTLITTHPFF